VLAKFSRSKVDFEDTKANMLGTSTDWFHGGRVYHRIDFEKTEQGTTPENSRFIWSLAGDPTFSRMGLAGHCGSLAAAGKLRHRLRDCDAILAFQPAAYPTQGQVGVSRK